MLGIQEVLPSNELTVILARSLCNDDALTQFICSNIVFLICGFDKPNLNTSILPIIFAHTPAGAATRQIAHYAQGINTGNIIYLSLLNFIH